MKLQLVIEDSLSKVWYQNWLKTPAGKLKKLHPDWDQPMCDKEYQRVQNEYQKSQNQKYWFRSPAGKIQKKHPSWSKDDCEKLANRELWIGMHIEMVKYLRGSPDNSNLSNYGNGNQYQYCWWGRNPSCFYCDSDGLVDSYN